MNALIVSLILIIRKYSSLNLTEICVKHFQTLTNMWKNFTAQNWHPVQYKIVCKLSSTFTVLFQSVWCPCGIDAVILYLAFGITYCFGAILRTKLWTISALLFLMFMMKLVARWCKVGCQPNGNWALCHYQEIDCLQKSCCTLQASKEASHAPLCLTGTDSLCYDKVFARIRAMEHVLRWIGEYWDLCKLSMLN